MAAAVPHRGSRVETLVHGRCGLACVNGDDPADAGVATSGDIAAAFAGRLDNASELEADLERRRLPLTDRSPAGLLAAGLQRLRGAFTRAPPRRVRRRGHRRASTFMLSATNSAMRRCSTALTRMASSLRARPSRWSPAPEFRRSLISKSSSASCSTTSTTRCRAALRGVGRLPKATLLATADARRATADVLVARVSARDGESLGCRASQERFNELHGSGRHSLHHRTGRRLAERRRRLTGDRGVRCAPTPRAQRPAAAGPFGRLPAIPIGRRAPLRRACRRPLCDSAPHVRAASERARRSRGVGCARRWALSRSLAGAVCGVLPGRPRSRPPHDSHRRACRVRLRDELVLARAPRSRTRGSGGARTSSRYAGRGRVRAWLAWLFARALAPGFILAERERRRPARCAGLAGSPQGQ